MTPPPELPELRPAWVPLRELAEAARDDWDTAEVDRQILAAQNSQVPFGTALGEVARLIRIAGPLDLRHLLPRRAEDAGHGGPPRNPEYLAAKASLTKGTAT